MVQDPSTAAAYRLAAGLLRRLPSGYINLTMFWIPALASLILLYVLANEGELSGNERVLFLSWFIASLMLQLFARNAIIWIVGLVTQAALAVSLAIKWNLTV